MFLSFPCKVVFVLLPVFFFKNFSVIFFFFFNIVVWLCEWCTEIVTLENIPYHGILAHIILLLHFFPHVYIQKNEKHSLLFIFNVSQESRRMPFTVPHEAYVYLFGPCSYNTHIVVPTSRHGVVHLLCTVNSITYLTFREWLNWGRSYWSDTGHSLLCMWKFWALVSFSILLCSKDFFKKVFLNIEYLHW